MKHKTMNAAQAFLGPPRPPCPTEVLRWCHFRSRRRSFYPYACPNVDVFC